MKCAFFDEGWLERVISGEIRNVIKAHGVDLNGIRSVVKQDGIEADVAHAALVDDLRKQLAQAKENNRKLAEGVEHWKAQAKGV